MPFPAHRLSARDVTLRELERPFLPSGETGAHAGIVLGKASIQVGGPADIRLMFAEPHAPEDVYEERHRAADGPGTGKFRISAKACKPPFAA